jgi:DNA-directed RNA polymerase subunit RPC12/RpoP
MIQQTLTHASFYKIPHPRLNPPGRTEFASQNVGQQIPCPHCRKSIALRKPDFLKMACFFCQEHIEFPAHAIGEKMPCPHCKLDITLKEPA